jgi:hypothetical protein
MNRNIAPFALSLLALTLAACGGGGSSTTTPPAATIYTASTACASGPALTSTVSQAAADALVPASCPALTTAQLSSIAVNRSATGALTLAGLPTGVTWSSRSVAFSKGGVTIAGTIDAAGNITPTSALAAGTWTVTFTGQPVGAPAVVNLPLSTSVVIPALVCAIGQNTVSGNCVTIATPLAGADKWNAATSARVPAVATDFTWLANGGGTGIGVWAANTGIRISAPTTLPATVVNVGDAAYKAEAAAGRIKYAYDGVNLYGYYITPNGISNTLVTVVMPINPSSGVQLLASSAIGNSGGTLYETWVQSNSNSFIRHYPDGTCWRASPDQNGNWSQTQLGACPN